MSKKIHQELLERFQKNKTITRVLSLNGCLDIEKKGKDDIFLYLARIVAGQQLSKAAADTIWGRIENSAKEFKVSIYDLSHESNFSTLKTCGLSKFKIKAILGLREAIDSNAINEEIYNTTDQEIIIAEISKLWGFGQWSAEMSALFFFGLPDIWSDQDAALERAISTISDYENITNDQIIETAAPYKSYLALHLWKAIDTKIL